VVYLHPGNYLVSDTLEFVQDIFKSKNNDSATRYGQMLLGSYCGHEKPTITLIDGVVPKENKEEPFPVVLFWCKEAG
jgi:hypothetical protein